MPQNYLKTAKFEFEQFLTVFERFLSPWMIKLTSSLLHLFRHLNPNQTGGGANGPPGFKSLISPQPKVGLTSNQAVNSSLSVVSKSKKIITIYDHGRTKAGL